MNSLRIWLSEPETLKYLKSISASDEVCSTLVEKLLDGRITFSPEIEKTKERLFREARHLNKNHRRRLQRERQRFSSNGDNEVSTAAASENETPVLLEDLFPEEAELSVLEKIVLYLRHVQDYNFEEIARSVNSSYPVLSRALKSGERKLQRVGKTAMQDYWN
jgi:DNA-directed RNA polymerase specialized sigma24 family protein